MGNTLSMITGGYLFLILKTTQHWKLFVSWQNKLFAFTYVEYHLDENFIL
jgi:hypothetical protein